MPNCTSLFKPPPKTHCQYVSKEIKIYDYENREPKTACADYSLLTHISEIKNGLGIDTGILQKNAGCNMQKHMMIGTNFGHKHLLLMIFSKWQLI
jgi:hypothetical protein